MLLRPLPFHSRHAVASRHAVTGIALLFASCHLEVSRVDDRDPGGRDGSVDSDADVDAMTLPATSEGGASSPSVPTIPPFGSSFEAGFPVTERGDAGDSGLDAGDGGLGDADAGPAKTPPDTGVDAEMEASTDKAPSTALCPTAKNTAAPASPHSLELRTLSRIDEPAFRERRLGPVAYNGAQRLWLFRSEFREDPGVGTPGGDLPIAAYDRSPVRDLTASASTKLDFTVGSGPLVTRLPNEPVYTPNRLDAVTLEPNAFVPNVDPAKGGEIFLYKLFGVQVERPEIWLADIRPGETQATRHSAALWKETQAASPEAALRGEKYLTLYKCDYENPGACTVARVANGSEGTSSAYEYRTRDARGNWSWTPDASAATPVITGLRADLTISYNKYLEKYLAVHAEGEFFPRSIVLQTAPAPEGPWTRFATIPVMVTTEMGFIAFAREQPALGDPCGKRVALSYFEGIEINKRLHFTHGFAVLAYVELP